MSLIPLIPLIPLILLIFVTPLIFDLRRLSLAPREYLLSFDSQGHAQFVRPVNSATLWRSNPRKPLLPVYHIALRPMFERLGMPWSPPPAPSLALMITIGIILTLISTFTWLIFTQA